jgi:hypothetical protein
VTLFALGAVITSARSEASTVGVNGAVTASSDATVLGGEDHCGRQEQFRSLETNPRNVPMVFGAAAAPGDQSGVTASHIEMAQIDLQKSNENTFAFDDHIGYDSSIDVVLGSVTNCGAVYVEWGNPDARHRGVSEIREVRSDSSQINRGLRFRFSS